MSNFQVFEDADAALSPVSAACKQNDHATLILKMYTSKSKSGPSRNKLQGVENDMTDKAAHSMNRAMCRREGCNFRRSFALNGTKAAMSASVLHVDKVTSTNTRKPLQSMPIEATKDTKKKTMGRSKTTKRKANSQEVGKRNSSSQQKFFKKDTFGILDNKPNMRRMF
eukprot:m.27242 g.27242  ORF g.27242 m.27242 type:complete len:168 (+) comp7879_c0_seq2:49-552(+)